MPRTAVFPAGTAAADIRLLNDWQRGFPLVARPFAELGAALGLPEPAVLEACRRWRAQGVISRIGAVFAPRRIGSGALAAMAVPPGRLESVAARVNAEPGVNHNYEREHRFNLWFVIVAPDAATRDARLAALGTDTGCPPIVLPLLEEYHIDLGFDLTESIPDGARRTDGPPAPPAARGGGLADGGPTGPAARQTPLAPAERRVLAALQDGLPIVEAPYAELGRRIGEPEAGVVAAIRRALDSGLIRRFGLVLRHHELGIRANAMCVWDVADGQVSALGHRLAREKAVTLCYRRPRVLPDWPYNLFCMIHGSDRQAVLDARGRIAARLGLDGWPHAVLFSGRRFRQRGARYLAFEETSANA